jgi:hypothetical protein
MSWQAVRKLKNKVSEILGLFPKRVSGEFVDLNEVLHKLSIEIELTSMPGFSTGVDRACISVGHSYASFEARNLWVAMTLGRIVYAPDPNLFARELLLPAADMFEWAHRFQIFSTAPWDPKRIKSMAERYAVPVAAFEERLRDLKLV